MAIEAKHPLIAKAVRIVLVFSLVFWSSLNVEWAIAFGAEGASGTSTAAQADGSASASGAGSASQTSNATEKPADQAQTTPSGTQPTPADTETTPTQPSSPEPAAPSNPTPTQPSEPEDTSAADRAAADGVASQIASLPSAGAVTAADKATVDGVAAAYNALTATQQGYVDSSLVQKLFDVQAAANAAAEAEKASEFTEEERFDAAKHKAGELTGIEAWTVDPKNPDPKTAEKLVRNVDNTVKGLEYDAPKLSTIDGELKVIAVPMWKGDDKLQANWKPKALVASFLKWTVEGNDGYAEVSTKDGMLTVKALKEGSFTVTCKLDDGKNEKGEQVGRDYNDLIYDSFNKDYQDFPKRSFEVSFTVEVLAPYVDIELLQADGTTCAGLKSLSLNAEQLKSYEFQANVRVYDQISDGVVDEFHCTKDQKLRAVSQAKYGEQFQELTWQVLDAERNPVADSVASITDGGVLSVKGDLAKDGPFIVNVSSPDGFNHNAASAEIMIGNYVEDPQGESHPQDSLHIVSNGKVKKSQQDGDAQQTDTPAEGEQSEPKPATQADGDQPQGGSSSADAANPANAGSADANPAGAGDASADAADAEEQLVAIDKTYSVAQLEALGTTRNTYSMVGGAGGSLSVTGEGVSLALLLADAGITDLSQVISLEFVDYRGVATALTWDSISSGGDPVMALRSRVMTSADSSGQKVSTQADPETGGSSASSSVPSGASQDSSANSPAAATSGGANAGAGTGNGGTDSAGELLDNTRFRLLFNGSAGVDPDELRYINEIRVNLASSDEGGSADGDLGIRIDYVPVPRGKIAVLSAMPSQTIGGARFGVRWQSSSDRQTWTDVAEGSVQTLRIMTDDEHLNRWYRVILETEMTDPKTGEMMTATSESVQIKEGEGFSATLAYDPPVAGQTAIFQSSVEAFVDGQQVTIDASKLEYVWEQSQDGGITWEIIENATGPSFAVPTEPVVETPTPSPDESNAQDGDDGASDEGGSGDEGGTDEEPVTLRYVRVRVITTDTRIPEKGRVAISNAQPLTVRVGGAGEDENGDNNAGVQDEEEQTGTAPTLPIDQTITEVPSIRVDNTPRPTASTSSGVAPDSPQPAQAPQPEAQQQPQPAANEANNQMKELTPDELLINPEITALVQSQEEAIDKTVTASRPGARWTQLSTVDPTDDDVRRILADNPFAPFVIPLGLGITIAGGLEKLLAFRRQTS